MRIKTHLILGKILHWFLNTKEKSMITLKLNILIIKQDYCTKNKIPLMIIPFTAFSSIETEVQNFLKSLGIL